MTDLFCDNVSMFIREMFLAHLLPRKIFNLITLRTEKSFFVTINVLNCGNKGS